MEIEIREWNRDVLIKSGGTISIVSLAPLDNCLEVEGSVRRISISPDIAVETGEPAGKGTAWSPKVVKVFFK